MDSINIICSTYNGTNYLKEQLQSIIDQKDVCTNITVTDDGSSDDTLTIVQKYIDVYGKDKIQLIAGPNNGYAQNFISGLKNTNDNTDYYAFSDQDDVWKPEKLAAAVAFLKSTPKEIPALYCSRTILVDEKLNNIGYSPLFTQQPSFNNAIIQNIAGGNTMVFNQKLKDILLKFNYSDCHIVSHDWWVYIVVTAVGGVVKYDENPYIYYRQHADNLIGKNNGIYAKLHRVKALFQGQFRKWNDANIQLLLQQAELITANNLFIVEKLVQIKKQSLIKRLISYQQIKIYRQTFLGNLGLLVAVIFKKI